MTLRALKKGNIVNDVVVTRDGVEALDYLFGTGNYAGRDLTVMPQVVLLDLKLPKVDGLEVLRKLRSDRRTRSLPVVIFTSSSEEEDMFSDYSIGPNSYVRKPVQLERFMEAANQLGLCWLLLNEAVPGGLVSKAAVFYSTFSQRPQGMAAPDRASAPASGRSPIGGKTQRDRV